MEAPEEVMAMASYTTTSSSSNSTSSPDEAPRPLSIKRSRTRRHPPISSASTAAASSSASESGFTDEEDMANCLILLAQGGGDTVSAGKKFTSKKFAEAAAATAAGRAGFYVYECKTCNKSFPSFQALGGHRASHKKLKMAAEAAAAGEKKGAGDEISHLLVSLNSVSKRTDSVGKGKVHECLICRSEFSSGQALGGHMRRHRPAVDLPEELKKEKTVLALDLNLPAPAEDDTPFAIPGKPLVFSPAPPLVDCLY